MNRLIFFIAAVAMPLLAAAAIFGPRIVALHERQHAVVPESTTAGDGVAPEAVDEVSRKTSTSITGQETEAEKAARYLKYIGVPVTGESVRAAAAESRTYSLDLLAKAGIDMDAADSDGATALMQSARAGSTAVLEKLVSLGARLDVQDSAGRTALVHAVEAGQNRAAMRLLGLGASHEVVDGKGWRAIHHAIALSDAEMVRALLDADSPVDALDEREAPALQLAADTGNLEILHALLETNPARIGWTEKSNENFWKAYQNKDAPLLDLLTRAHNQPPALPGATQPLLAHAVLWNDAELVRRLLEWGASPDTLLQIPADPQFIATTGKDGLRFYLENETGMSVLMLAAGLGYVECVQALVDGGASRNLATEKYRMVAQSFAGRTGNAESLLVLLGKSPREEDQELTIKISLSTQKATIYKNGVSWLKTSVSTGRGKFPTPTGRFVITDKHRSHMSTIYEVPMPWFMRLSGRDFGMHEGYVPGYAASHGCIRVPAEMARKLYKIAGVGTLVTITD